MGTSSRWAIAFRIWRVVMPSALILSALSIADTTHRLEAFSRSPFPLSPTVPYKTRLAVAPPQETVADAAVRDVSFPVTRLVERGETLGEIFRDLGLRDSANQEAVQAVTRLVDVRKIRPGVRYSAYYGPGEQLADFEMSLTEVGRLQLTRRESGWESVLTPYVRQVETRRIAGDLDGDLESSIRRAGGDPAVAYRMADVLEYDLDFTRDLKTGDHFELIYEEVLLDGRPHALGNLVALRYENRNKTLEAYRSPEGGYYDADGRPLRKMFLRCPLPYSRITSRFTQRRFHPVLHEYRPHLGVDYGAPTGTPVRVTANGVVEFVGWDRGGGKSVRVRHPGDYVTAYLHLSRYASGLRTGSRVSQGDLIGYVGATGLATGPHLDYRVKYRGNWIDPLSIGRERAEAISAAQLPAFHAWRDTLRAALSGSGPLPGQAGGPSGIVTAASSYATGGVSSAGSLVRR